MKTKLEANFLTRLVLPIALLATGTLASAAPAQENPKQIAVPQPSPAASVALTVGVSKLSIDYHSPGVKGRKVWGDLVPYQKTWRMGANEATKFTISDPCKINGKDLPAGSYALFAIPTRDNWTLMFNKVSEQWGDYQYKAKEDALRIEVTPKEAPMRERLVYTIEPGNDGEAVVSMLWDKLSVSFTLQVDVAAMMVKKIDEAIAAATPKDYAIYLQAARYYFDNKLSDEKALGWVDQSIAGKEIPQNLELKAKLLARVKKTKEAITVLDKAIEIAKADAKFPKGYWENLEKLRDEWKKAQ